MKTEEKTSANGNPYTKLMLVASDGISSKVWNAVIFSDLRALLPEQLFEEKKYRYAKFIGKASERPYKTKDGKDAMSHDLLVQAVETQSGEYIYAKKDKGENADEDAPF